MAKRGDTIWMLGGGLIGLAALVAGVVMSLRPTVETEAVVRVDDPNDLIDLAWSFVEEGRPDRLPELIHAESPEMEAVLARIGRLLDGMHELAQAIQARFPEESMRLREDAFAAASGSSFAGQARNAARDGPDEQFLSKIFADPFGWLREARDRVSVVYIADDARAVMFDDKPAFGVGLTIREYDDGWRVALPMSLPIVRRYMPQSRDEWTIVASMVTVLENAVRDLADDVESGRVRNLSDAARAAGEKAWAPLVMTIVAYQRVMQMRISEGQVR